MANVGGTPHERLNAYGTPEKPFRGVPPRFPRTQCSRELGLKVEIDTCC